MAAEARSEEDENANADDEIKSSSKASPDVSRPEADTEKRPDVEHQAMASEDYSIFTTGQKRAIIVSGSFAAWFSPMTGSIYYPALNSIAADLHVSSSKVNITVTTYLIVQGLAPMMIAGFSDKAGRRPAYFICFTIYIVANLALALQNDYTALLLLRMLQSAGSSGTVALANGLVGDCITSADRGQYIAFASLGTILGPTLSPILGGLISQIFWFLLILSIAFFIPLAIFLPETCRKIVGDGSFPPPWTSWNLSDKIRHRRRMAQGIQVDENKLAELRKNYKIVIPSPVSTLIVLTDPESVLILLGSGFALACFYAISTGASTSFHTLYGFDDLCVSLMFLPIGGGGVISAFTTGMLVDWNYRRHAKRLNFPVKRNRQTDLSDFPIELVRMKIALPLLLVGAIAIIGYGWMLSHKISLAGPAIMLFILGYCLTAGFQVLNVLMVDIYPGKPATATAASNVTRCLLGAAASAAITPMSEAIGNGWAYTILAVLFLISTIGPITSMRYGISWRKAKREKAGRKKQAKQEKASAAR
ncbi:MFS transporter M6 [Pseudocercospora fuligena]|uniref:MFS transporter M6 n=1 Tax=Pseudocercospora fuligena TaxID=685502 RepID=A0A8H6RFD2_9PEZI|nr:MFS transporter M6 [Pseudocercospora fuligena]